MFFAKNSDMYFNYHAKAKSLIKAGELEYFEILDDYHGIKPAIVLYFSSHKPMPIRQHRWAEYFEIIKSIDETIDFSD